MWGCGLAPRECVEAVSETWASMSEESNSGRTALNGVNDEYFVVRIGDYRDRWSAALIACMSSNQRLFDSLASCILTPCADRPRAVDTLLRGRLLPQELGLSAWDQRHRYGGAKDRDAREPQADALLSKLNDLPSA